MKDFIPIAVCCIMPIAIVLIIFAAEIVRKNINAKVLTNALDHTDRVDINKLASQLDMKSGRKNDPVQTLYRRLKNGCIFTLLGIGLLTMIAFVTNPGPIYADDNAIMLTVGGILCLCIGIGNLAVYLVSRKNVLSRDNGDNNDNTGNDTIIPGA